MYAMKFVTSSLFQVMMFPHNGKVVTIDQLTYHEPSIKGPPDNIISQLQNYTLLIIEIRPRVIKNSTLLGAYHGDPPVIPQELFCVLSTDEDLTSSQHNHNSPTS